MESPLCPPRLEQPRVIETLAWDGQQCVRLDKHMARLERTCAKLGYALDVKYVLAQLQQLHVGVVLRVRVTVGNTGDVEVTNAPLAASAHVWRLAIASQRLQADDPWLQIKTTQRALYDQVRAALPAGLEEIIFCNERGEVCEGTITNVFFDAGQGLCTPPLLSGLLPGVLREELLASGTCQEAVLHQDQLPHVRLWVGNSLRGLIPAVLTALVSGTA